MECSLYCQICCKRFEAVLQFKQHITSKGHKQMLQDVFQKEFIHCTYRIPYIAFVTPKCKNIGFQKPAVGLSLITLCFSQKPDLSFYLCHVCKDTYTMDTILCHTFSECHCFHYFVYTNPDYLSFSWKPDVDMATVMGWKLKRESRKSELQTLRLLHLPPPLIKKLMLSTYSEVMQTLRENDKLLERFETVHQNRVTLQGYHSNHNRQHPLLGLQHIVECFTSEPEPKYYLCTLCRLVIPSHTIIGHLLSSDHVHLYFKAWYPSTLTSNELDRNSFLLDCAKQAEKIHAAENVSVQQVELQPDVFKSVNFDSYSEALKSLESVTKRCLTVSIKPGDKIDHHPASAPSTKEVKCILYCQNCCTSFSNMFKYLEHLTSKQHIRIMQEISQDFTGHFYDRGKFYVDLYTYINESLKTNVPPVGTSLVMTCLTSVSNDDPFYLCFACQDWFCQADIRNHFESRKHLISTQLYQNPWLLPFGWDGDLDDGTLRWTAWKEEQNGARIILKIFDVPHSVFQWLLTDTRYEQVFRSLQVQYRGFMHRVPQRKTCSKHKGKEFPLLGQEFLALHNVALAPNEEDVGCLCLLCERRLCKEEIEAHVFSREHVSKFLDCFHPGSLTSCAVDAETLLDLAKQAAGLHPLSCMQKISLDKPMWDSCSYQEAKMFLTNVKRITDYENLVPPINPMRKLVSRIPLKPTNKRQKTEDQKTCTVTDTKEKGLNQEEQGSAKEALSRETKEGSQKVCLKDLKNEGATVLPVKLSTEEAMTENPKEKVVESQRNTEENNSAPTKPEATQQQTNKRKRPMIPDEASENGCKMSPKRQRLASDESHFEESTKMSHESGTKVTNTNAADKEEDHKKAVCYSNERGGVPDSSDKKPTSNRPDQRKSSLSENSHTSPVPKSNKEPADGRSGAGSSPRSANAKYKADVSPTKTKSLTSEAATKSEKPRTVPSTAPMNTLKSTAGPSTQTKTTSKTSTPQFQTASMAPKGQTPSKETCSAASSSDTGSAATLKRKHPLKSKDPAALKTEEASSAASEMAKPQVINVNTKPSVKTLTGGNPDSETAARKRKPPASHHRKPEEAKKVWKDLPHDASSKTTPGGNFPKVGLNYLVVVSCERKQQVFCLLCSVRLNASSHPRNPVHQYKYVKMKYPEWSGKENMENELSRIVHKLANVDKELPHTQIVQRLEVKTDEYQTLRKLPDHLAIENVKTLLKQRDLKASSSRLVDDTEHPPKDISSPCDVSSSGDWIPAFHDDMSDSADDHQLWASLDQASEIECADEDDAAVSAGQSLSETSSDEEDVQVVEEIQDEAMQTQDPQQVLDQCAQAEDTAETIQKSAERRRPAELQRHQSSSGKNLEAQNLIQEHQQSMSDSKINPNPIPDYKAEDVAETPQQNQLMVQNDSRPHREVALSRESLATSVETTSKNQDSLLTSERQRLKSDAAFQEPQKAEKVSPATVAGEQNQSGHKAEPAPALHLRPEERSSSQANSAALTGKNVLQSSDLRIFLTASNQDPNKVAGRAYVWECHSLKHQKTFLCETCEEMLSSRDICQHMVSLDHQLKFLWREDQRFLEMFWLQDDLPTDFKNQVLMNVIQELSKREKALNVEPECIWLTSESHKFLLAAPFSKALELLKSIRDKDLSDECHPSGSAGHQRHKNGQQTAEPQSIQESLPANSMSAQMLEKDQGREMADQNPGKAQPKEPTPAESFDAAGSGRTSGMDVISSSSKNDHVVLPDPNVAAQNLRPLEVNSPNSKIDPVVPSSSTVVDLSLEPCSSSLQPHYISSVSQIGGTPRPQELNAPYSRHNLVVPSGPTNPKPNTFSGDPLQPGFHTGVSQLRRNSGPLDVSSNSVTELIPSSSINLDQPISSINWRLASKLLSVLKTGNQSALHTAERREGMTMSQSLVPQENALVPTTDLGEPHRLHISVPKEISRIGRPKPSETGINQLPINAIITSRSSHIKQTFKGQTRTDVSRWQQPPTPSHTETAASPGGVDPYIQPAYPPSNVHPGSAPTQSQLPLDALGYQQYPRAGYCWYPNQSYLQPVVNPMNMHSFSFSLTEQMPVVWTNADMQMYNSRRPESEQ
ncbi:uncharacterized protein LOC103472337 isoform X3 [Poecilia reticulata]|uniref:uncharacterized protein LOC103472337 isoform X3 n=1 Tax=Poecilia reticulata TaxID=8081 RepID=UPI0007E9B89B|nr:PREDICTED: uncharacterized protein LOC103472337 isoform X3 [Poecilia reticulata]